MAKLNEVKDNLEKAMDSGISLFDILQALSWICYEKAAHLRSNWQDPRTAKQWEHDAKVLDRVSANLNF